MFLKRDSLCCLRLRGIKSDDANWIPFYKEKKCISENYHKMVTS